MNLVQLLSILLEICTLEIGTVFQPWLHRAKQRSNILYFRPPQSNLVSELGAGLPHFIRMKHRDTVFPWRLTVISFDMLCLR